MTALVIFGAGALGTVLDPFGFIAYIVAGILARRWWQALLAGALWAIVCEVIVVASLQGYEGYTFGRLLPQRIFGALAACALVYGAKHLFKLLDRQEP